MITPTQADSDPTLPVDYQWRNAHELAADPTLDSSDIEPIVRDAAAYLRSGVAHSDPVIHAARVIHDEDGIARAEIEARILAGQSDNEIATACDESRQLIAVYEALFLCVRRYLRATDWILSQTVGGSLFREFRDHELRQLWARYALSGGPLIIDELVNSYRRSARPGDSPSLSVYFRRDAEVRHELLADIAVEVIPYDDDGGCWSREFGTRQLEALTIKDAVQSRAAIVQLQHDVIAVGRRALSGESLACPSPAKPVTTKTTKPKSKTSQKRLVKSA